MAKLKAILLDLDGTLRDTVEVIYEAMEHSFVQLGALAHAREAMEPYAHYHDHVRAQFLPHVTTEDFEAVYIKRADEAVLHAPLYEGVSEMIRQLKQQGYKLAIVSSGNNIADYLRVVQLADVFDVIVAARDVTHKKPHPEPVETALTRLGVTADEAIMVGDLPADLQSAHAAGITRTIGVSYGMGAAESLRQAGATYITATPYGIAEAVKKEADND